MKLVNSNRSASPWKRLLGDTCDVMMLIHMALTGAASNWFGSLGPKSIALINARFYANLWNAIWTRIKHFLDKDRPVAKKWHRTILKDFTPQLDDYITRCTELVAEVPLCPLLSLIGSHYLSTAPPKSNKRQMSAQVQSFFGAFKLIDFYWIECE